VDVEVALEGLAAHGAAHTWSLDEPAGHDDGGAGSGDRARFAAALSRAELEFDLVEHREGLAPLLAAMPKRERVVGRRGRVARRCMRGQVRETRVG
jgi:hypothetical protein